MSEPASSNGYQRGRPRASTAARTNGRIEPDGLNPREANQQDHKDTGAVAYHGEEAPPQLGTSALGIEAVRFLIDTYKVAPTHINSFATISSLTRSARKLLSRDW